MSGGSKHNMNSSFALVCLGKETKIEEETNIRPLI
jgi:hypothetical protein